MSSYVALGRLVFAARASIVLSILATVAGILAALVTGSGTSLIAVGAAVVFCGVTVVLSHVWQRKYTSAFRRAIADALGITFAGDRAQGAVDGVQVTSEVVRTTGRYGGLRTMWRLRPAEATAPCHVQWVHSSYEADGAGARVEMGEPDFDGSFAVHARDAAAARSFLDLSRRQALARLHETCRRSGQSWCLRSDGLMVTSGAGTAEGGAAAVRAMVGWAKAIFDVVPATESRACPGPSRSP